MNGNLKERSDGLKLDYNATDHTTAITPPLAAGGAAAKLTMGYSGLDQTQRVCLQRGSTSDDHCDPNATTATTFTYDELGIGPSSVDPGTPGEAPSDYTRKPRGGLVSLRRGGNTFYYVRDRLGSVIALIGFNSSTSEPFIANRYAYDPWGNILTEQEAAGAAQPFRFASAEYDAATRLYKMGARYYDSSIGRFTQPDPVGGWFSYAVGDPVNVIDPTGLQPMKPTRLTPALWGTLAGAGIMIAIAICIANGVCAATFTVGALTLESAAQVIGFFGATGGAISAGLAAATGNQGQETTTAGTPGGGVGPGTVVAPTGGGGSDWWGQGYRTKSIGAVRDYQF
jgi:RHS repeat-associated protein